MRHAREVTTGHAGPAEGKPESGALGLTDSSARAISSCMRTLIFTRFRRSGYWAARYAYRGVVSRGAVHERVWGLAGRYYEEGRMAHGRL